MVISHQSESCLVVSDSLQPQGLYNPWNSPGKNTGVGSLSTPGDHLNLGIKSRSPTLQVDSVPAEPQVKPKNTSVGSLSLFQQIFPTQESNWALLYCRKILYQLSWLSTRQLVFPRLSDPKEQGERCDTLYNLELPCSQ